ncbi:MAG: helix-turn-helix transcriptional regulator [Clostridiales bacterium]|nr:helix-turn-helix transcriptional regulator [Clostridiales bacterium]
MKNKELEFKDTLKSFLKEYDLTQTAFASMIGVKQSQVSEWLSGKAKPGYENLRAMVIAFGIPAEYFLCLESD